MLTLWNIDWCWHCNTISGVVCAAVVPAGDINTAKEDSVYICGLQFFCSTLGDIAKSYPDLELSRLFPPKAIRTNRCHCPLRTRKANPRQRERRRGRTGHHSGASRELPTGPDQARNHNRLYLRCLVACFCRFGLFFFFHGRKRKR